MAQVRGFADQQPREGKDSADPSNRRITPDCEAHESGGAAHRKTRARTTKPGAKLISACEGGMEGNERRGLKPRNAIRSASQSWFCRSFST